jgi:hypothetical protein
MELSSIRMNGYGINTSLKKLRGCLIRVCSSLHSPPSPPILGGSDPQNPPVLGSHFRGRVPRLEESGADLGGECNGLATFQTTSEVLALGSVFGPLTFN